MSTQKQFESAQWAALSPEQRVLRCRFMARETQNFAKGAAPELRLLYMNLTIEWLALAEKIERAR